MCASKKQSKILDNGDGTGQREDANASGTLKAVSDGSDSQNVMVRASTGGVGTVEAGPLPVQPLQSRIMVNGDGVVQHTDTNVSSTAKASNSQNVGVRSPTSAAGAAPSPAGHSRSSIMNNGQATGQRNYDAGQHKDTSIPNASKASTVSDGSSSQSIMVQTPMDPNVSNTPKDFPVSGGSEAQNIVVLGPTGGSASSVFNLIIGKEVASVSNDTPRCTTEVIAYPIELGSAGGAIPCTLYDMPDFNSSPPALPSGDINLAVVCMEDRTPQVKEALHYLNDWEKHNGCNMPVLVVINHMSPRPDPNWWETNKEHFTKLRLVVDHACLTRTKGQKNTEGLRSLIIELLSRRA